MADKLTFFEFLKEWSEFKKEFLELKEVVASLSPVPVEPVKVVSKYPVPEEYRNEVNHILNQKFGVELTPRIDIPSFEFNIIVPAEYGNTENDIRLKVISNAEGVLGVRIWAERVLDSFSPDVKSRIALERV